MTFRTSESMGIGTREAANTKAAMIAKDTSTNVASTLKVRSGATKMTTGTTAGTTPTYRLDIFRHLENTGSGFPIVLPDINRRPETAASFGMACREGLS